MIRLLFPMFDTTAIRAEKSSVDFVAMITTKCRVNCSIQFLTSQHKDEEEKKGLLGRMLRG